MYDYFRLKFEEAVVWSASWVGVINEGPGYDLALVTLEMVQKCKIIIIHNYNAYELLQD